jgi:transcriptional regulator with XRE-family HTH domain
MTRTAKKEPVTEVGRQLRAARKAAGIDSGKEAGDRVGMAQSNYWRLENKQARPGWPAVHRLIVSLNLGLEHFFPRKMILEAARRIEGNGRRK